MAGYVFIGNSTKPSVEKLNSREEIKLDNVARPCLLAALNQGFDVVVGVNRNNPEELRCEELPVSLYDSHTYRSIFALKDNYIAYKNISKLIRERDIQVIHCNTPVGGMVGRFAGKRHSVKKIIYTAHGFHFYKGAPLLNQTIFKLAEIVMAHWTDAIITMNQEDYEAAQKFRLRKGGKVYKVHGVGITLSEYESIEVDKYSIYEELGLNDKDIVCISAGDLVKRKNYDVAIEAISKTDNPYIHYLICGAGPERDRLEIKVKNLGIEKQIHFLGFRTDIKELLKISDVFVLTSLQEGLPRSLMEAMAIGLPVIASKIRGNIDLIEDGKGGLLCQAVSSDEFAHALEAIANDSILREKMSEHNLQRIKEYDIGVVENEIEEIYEDILA